MKTHTERCHAECTRDPVFLFQRRRYIGTGMPYTDDGEYYFDGEGVILGDVGSDHVLRPREDTEYLTNKQLAEMETAEGVPCLIETWDTESVWLDRDEAEAWGNAKSYRFGDGWRVYSVPAMGDLTAILTAVDGGAS